MSIGISIETSICTPVVQSPSSWHLVPRPIGRLSASLSLKGSIIMGKRSWNVFPCGMLDDDDWFYLNAEMPDALSARQ